MLNTLLVNMQDGLLTSGYADLISRIHKQIPQVTPDGKRLQMVVCSATLHSPDVRRMAVSFTELYVIYVAY